MLQFLNLSATLAAVVITQTTGITLPSAAKDANNQWVQASTDNLVVSNDVAAAIPAILTADANELERTQTNPAWMFGLAALVGGGAGLALAAKNDSKRFKLNPTPSYSSGRSSDIRIEQASRHLQKKLLRLLHDQKDTANRLLTQAQIKNPDRSVDWCAEKVIYDLERDRGGY